MNEPARVLVVGAPDEAARDAEALEREDGALEALTAAGVAKALERLEADAVDCVVSEYDLPDGDGVALLESVREDHPGLPFVLRTEDTDAEAAGEASAAVVFEHVERPPGTDQAAWLARLVRDAVDDAQVDGAVRDTEAWYSTLLQYSSDYLFVVDETGHVSYVSPAIERVLGYEPEAVVGTTAFDFVHPDDVDKALEALGGILEDPSETATVEFRAEHAAGGYRWLEVRGRNLLDDPLVEGVLVNVRDVTDRKRQERELERQHDRLAEVARLLSHDLRNPLAVAMGNLDVARQERGDEELAAVWRALERMDELIDSVLAMTRLGEPVTETEPFWLSSLAEECWRNVTTGTADLQVAADRVVDGDRERLKRVFENLFRNAVEHGSTSSRRGAGDAVEHGSTSHRPSSDDAVEHGATSRQPSADDALEHGDADVTVRVGVLEDGIYVEDDGPGIPPDRRGRVFEPGYSTAEGGTGLGLNIVEDVVEAHGWAIEAVEAAGGGARFEITGLESEA